MKTKMMTSAQFDALSERYSNGEIDYTEIFPLDTVAIVVDDNGWIRIDAETKASRPATVINRVAKALCKVFDGIDDVAPWIKESVADGYFREAGDSFVWGLEAIDDDTWYFYINININVHGYITRR